MEFKVAVWIDLDDDDMSVVGILGELDIRKAKQEYWRGLVLELKNMTNSDYLTEGEV